MSKIRTSLKYINSLAISMTLSMGILSASSNKIEIKAKNIEAVNGIVIASENVVVHYDNMVIRASSATFNKITKILTLDGNIETIGYNGTKEHSNHMEINTETNEVTFEELFLLSENDVWIVSKNVSKKKKEYKLKTSVISSCDISDPLWTMRFSDSLYDIDEKYIKVYNAKLYMWDVPIFYTPYLGFSTNKERSSGLLFPLFGYTENEGLFYEQPIFWAISKSVDLEINPQIRTQRSLGIYGTLRFADTDHSSGVFRMGYFEDQESYTEKFNLPNSSHYGFEFNYESSEVFKKYLPKGFNDGLYVNTTYLNDIDYLTMQKNNLLHFGRTPIQESRVNYFLQDNDYYFGFNAKYFIDTRNNSENRDETLQVLPSLQLHKNLEHFIVENFTYSVDFKMNNFDRREGTTLQQAEFRIPLEFTTSFFDDFLNLSLSEELYYSSFFFGNGDFVKDDFQYYSNVHKIKLFTDLTKNYDSFTHVLQPSLQYLNGDSKTGSQLEYSRLDDKQKELFSLASPEAQYNFSLSQYFYDDEMTLKFYQRLTQKYYQDRSYQFADLENEMQYNFDALSLYNILGYSHEFSKIRFSSSSLTYTQSDYSLSIGHSYQQVLQDTPTAISTNDITFNFSYIYNKQVSLNGGFTYNIDEEESKQWSVGGKYYRDCWSLVASIRQDIRPTSGGVISENTYFLQLNFTPFGSIGTDTFNQLQQ